MQIASRLFGCYNCHAMQKLPLAALTAIALLAGNAFAGPNGDCTCRYNGGDIVEGQTACIRTPEGMQLALCDRVLNNTSWKFLGQPCPTASMTPVIALPLTDDRS
jgi:hypothetical protein